MQAMCFARRHPSVAAGERALRKRNRAVHEDFGHKVNGTPQTHYNAARIVQGAMARLYQSGAIDAVQLAAASEIVAVAERIGADVTVRTVSLETRVDRSPAGDGGFHEKLGWVRREVAYSAWRAALSHPQVVLAMIVGDTGIAAAARLHRMSVRRAKALLIAALDDWDGRVMDAVRAVDDATLAAAQAAIL